MKAKHLLVAVALTLSPAAMAASHSGSSAAGQTEAEVRKVDRDAGKITLKHQEIRNLEMPPMTMVFLVKDAKMLEGVKQGDKVRFTAEKIGGAFTVTAIEPSK